MPEGFKIKLLAGCLWPTLVHLPICEAEIERIMFKASLEKQVRETPHLSGCVGVHL
jgi:hypothetical protein